MDTGKILMGTAMLLLMIGLLVHPVGAVKSDDIFPDGQSVHLSGSGQAIDGTLCTFPNRAWHHRFQHAPVRTIEHPPCTWNRQLDRQLSRNLTPILQALQKSHPILLFLCFVSK